MSFNEENEIIKIILVGSSNVGKTSLINRYHDNVFSEKIKPTIAMNYIEHIIIINNIKIILNIWDTAGQEKYRACNKLFIKDSKIVIFVYDITSKESFKDLDFWYDVIDNELRQTPYLGLVGNKIDLVENEEVAEEEAREYANKWGAYFYLLSAKDDNYKQKVDFFFKNIVKLYLNKNEKNILKMPTIRLTQFDVNTIQESNNSCCAGGKLNKNQNSLKTIFIGDKKVGKTNIIKSILGQKINKKYEHTHNTIKNKYTCNLKNDKKISVNLIDTNGDIINNNQELKNVTKNCKIYFFVFDINIRDTFNKLNNCIDEIKNNYNGQKIFINILGNETNNPSEDNNCVTDEEGKEFAKSKGGIYKKVSIEDVNSLEKIIRKNIEKYLSL